MPNDAQIDTARTAVQGAVPGLAAAAGLSGRPIGEILRETAGLDPARLEEALALQRGEQAGQRLGEILVRLKAVTEEDVLRALAAQLDLPFVERIDPESVPGDLAAKVPIHFAKQSKVLPLGTAGDAIRVAVGDPLDTAAQDSVSMLLGAAVAPEVAPPQVVLDAINAVYDRAADEHDKLMEDLETEDLESVAHELQEPTDLLEADDEAPIIRLVNSLLFRAVKERASDIHILPEEKDISVRYRIDGVLREVIRPPKRFQASIGSRIKIMGGLNIAEKRLPQDGRIRIKIAGKDVDIRLSTVPTAHGERIVMRLLDKSNVVLDLAELGFEDWQLKVMDTLITRSHGIVLVTGPTGSGKTTTLYAALAKINSPDLNILTIEDPVEIPLKGVGQVQVNPKIDLTFASGLRSFLRQDPDVIMVGEIRDLETAEIAIQASLTGHLVLSTVHTNDAAGAITRLVDMGVQPFLVASSLVGVLAQRLVRVLCTTCKKPYVPTVEERALAGLTPEILRKAGDPTHLYKAVGCPACNHTGYQGRTGIYELMMVDDDVRPLILKSVDATTIKRAAVERGMVTLMEHGAYKVARGITTAAEVLSVTAEDIR
ncbi:type II secretion system ATPase GspE [Anaeromyxobacter dehalogenans]|uniref:protein-secreting ATPase n=1 Tax=Anaeromyxobacter dehalogenans (strain 2CP-C) TaxID=290397 RepID=Q2INT0_ANADE|nr:type II secretion system ATPase GspE [Anaeromyxobacter dehalogenans]ABC80461.1 type II secretion system protein E (GspE) [Anaeromyxobacter dehalogenans 2CP-C]